jgi:hypothetical protein
MPRSPEVNINHKYYFSIFWTVICLLLPSLRLIQKYLGTTGILIAPFGILALVFIAIFISRIRPRKEHKAWIYILYALLYGLLIVFFSTIYPIADSGSYGGIGSDRDDAINIGVYSILSGQYPYYSETYLGNPLSPLPGSFFIGAPFVILLGNSAYQNLFWLPAFFLLSRHILKKDIHNLALIFLVFSSCPIVIHEVAHGGDLLSNSIYILIAVIFMKLAIEGSGHPFWKVAASIFLGVAMASRLNFLFLFPLIFSSTSKFRLKESIIYVGFSCIIFLMITIPFYVYDPGSFSPLSLTRGHLDSRIPASIPSSIIPLSTLIITGLISWKSNLNKLENLLFFCSVVQMLPIVMVVVLQSWGAKQLALGADGFGTTGYGLTFVLFGVLSSAMLLFYSRSRDYAG